VYNKLFLIPSIPEGRESCAVSDTVNGTVGINAPSTWRMPVPEAVRLVILGNEVPLASSRVPALTCSVPEVCETCPVIVKVWSSETGSHTREREPLKLP